MGNKLNLSDRMNNYLLIGENFHQEGDIISAVENYEKAAKFASYLDKKIFIMYNIALIYDGANMKSEALDAYDRILKISTEEAGAYYGKAIIYEEFGQYEDAIENYKKAVEVDPDYDRAYYYLGNLYGNLGQYKEALQYLKKVIDIVEDYRAYNDIGAIYEELDRDQKASYYIDRSIDLYGEFYQSLYNKGVLLYKSGDYEKAMEYYYKALRYKKDFENLYLNMSEIYIEREDYMNAISLLNIGINNCEEAGDLYYNRACCYSILGKSDRSLNDLIRSIEIDQENLDYARNDGDFYNLREEDEFKNIIEDKE